VVLEVLDSKSWIEVLAYAARSLVEPVLAPHLARGARSKNP
jgi:hypothetical protein